MRHLKVTPTKDWVEVCFAGFALILITAPLIALAVIGLRYCGVTP